MKYVLDTNVACEGSRSAPDVRCLSWLREHQHDCMLTTITLAEMRYGVERLPEGKRRRALARNLDYLWQDYRDQVFSFEENAASEWGRYAAELEVRFGGERWSNSICAIRREPPLRAAAA
jgi:predicted nucleic acid-binding protein